MYVEQCSEWRTHQPVIKMVMSLVQPKFVLELGMGLFSTPIFLHYRPEQLICIDENQEWIDLLKSKHSFDPAYSVIYHEISKSISLGTWRSEIPLEEQDKILDFYFKLKSYIPELAPRFMFVDNYTGLRRLAMDALYPEFDIIAFHDCQPEGVRNHNYDVSAFTDSDLYILKCKTAWTGVLVKKRLGAPEHLMMKTIKPFIHEWNLTNDEGIMYFERQNSLILETW